MSHLSHALKKYYTKNGKRIIFKNGFTPAKMAIQMWERLGYSQVDGSVLSRVLSGTRLFTPSQLDVFVDILGLTSGESKLLHSALMQDYMSRDKFRPQISEFTKKVNDYTQDLLDLCKMLLVEGKYHELNDLAKIILKHIGEPLQIDNVRKMSYAQQDQIVWVLFYSGISCGMTNVRDIKLEMDAIIEKLHTISSFTEAPQHKAIYHFLFANAQYVRAEYKKLAGPTSFSAYRLVLKHSSCAIVNDSLNNLITLFSYRQMIIALSRLNMKQELEFLYNNLFSQINAISSEQDIFALRLYRSAFNEMEKLGITINARHKAVVNKRFGNLLEKTVLYQISDIRTQIYCKATTQAAMVDNSLIMLINKGLELSSMHGYYRHYNSIRKHKLTLMH